MLVSNAPYTSGSASTTIDESAKATATAAATAAISRRLRMRPRPSGLVELVARAGDAAVVEDGERAGVRGEGVTVEEGEGVVVDLDADAGGGEVAGGAGARAGDHVLPDLALGVVAAVDADAAGAGDRVLGHLPHRHLAHRDPTE